MTQTPSVAFCTRAIQTTRKQDLYALLDDMPMRTKDYAFLSDIIEGLDNNKLATKYNKSQSRISQWKRRVFEQLHRYIISQDENNLSTLETTLSRYERTMSSVENTLSRIENALSETEKSLSIKWRF